MSHDVRCVMLGNIHRNHDRGLIAMVDIIEHFFSKKPFHLGTYASQLVHGRRVVVIGKFRANDKTGKVIQLSFLDASRSPKDDLSFARADNNFRSAHGCDVGCSAFFACYVSSFPFHFKSIDGAWQLWDKDNDEAVPKMPWPMVRKLFRSQTVRFGEYGDPASVSLDVLERIAGYAGDHLGYTHRWRSIESGYAKYLMASVETAYDYVLASSIGYRPFWIVPHGTSIHDVRKQLPVSVSAPTPCVHDLNKVACVECPTPCNGTTWFTRKAGIFVQAHGQNAKKLKHN